MKTTFINYKFVNINYNSLKNMMFYKPQLLMRFLTNKT